MRSATKMRTLKAGVLTALLAWSYLGFYPAGAFGVSLVVWVVIEGMLVGGALIIVGTAVAEWAERDDPR